MAHSVPRSPLLDQCERDGGLHDRVLLALGATLGIRAGLGGFLKQALGDGLGGEPAELLLASGRFTHARGDVGTVEGFAGGCRDLLVGQRAVQRHPGQHVVAASDGVDGDVLVPIGDVHVVALAVDVRQLGVVVTLDAPQPHQGLHRTADLAIDARLQVEPDREVTLVVAAGRDRELTLADELIEHLALQVRHAVVADLFRGIELHASHSCCHVSLLIL